MTLRTRAWSIVMALSLGACAGPTLQVTTASPDTRVLVDGVQRGHGVVTIPQPYRGTIRVDALPARSEPPEPLRNSAETMVEVSGPVPGWLFPLDLLVEIAMSPWGPTQDAIELSTAPRPVIAAGQEPPIKELRARANQVLTAR